jgi:hypothetical protein
LPRYRYAGPAPVPDPENEVVHPGDVREYDEEPAWGPWELVVDLKAKPADGGPPPPADPPTAAPPLTVPRVTSKGK